VGSAPKLKIVLVKKGDERSEMDKGIIWNGKTNNRYVPLAAYAG